MRKQFLKIHIKIKQTKLSLYSIKGITTQRGNISMIKTII